MKLQLPLKLCVTLGCLAIAGLLSAQEDAVPIEPKPIEDSAKPVATDGPSKPSPPGTQTETTTYIQVLPSLGRAIDHLPEAFRSEPANRQLMEDLKYARQQDFTGTLEERIPRLSKSVGDITSRIHSESPPELLQPLTDLAVQLLAEIHSESGDSKWKSWFFTQLSQLEQRLAKEFPNRLELAATVRLERIKIQVIPKPGGSVDDYWVKAPAGLNAFLERYPNTIAAAQAAWLMGDACETAMNSAAGLPTPAVGQFPEPTFLWYHAAIKQAPDSLWGKLARGCLNRLDFVGQTLEVSGTSLVGKPLSLESFRGKPTVVVFFRPGKSSWGAAENPGDFADAVRQRGIQVLSVLCHSPTSAPDEIDKFLAPKTPDDGLQTPVIIDTNDVDTSYSVRYGLTVQRLFVLVDETGKVVRTQLSEIKDLDEFLGLVANPPAADSKSPADATLAQQPSTAGSAETPVPPAPANSTQEPSLMAFRVKHGLAANYAKLVRVMFPLIRVSADDRSNSIVIYGTQSELEKVEALMLAMDQAATGVPVAAAQLPEAAPVKRDVYFFTAAWCGPCQRALPILRSIIAQGQPIQFVDVDHEPELTRQRNVSAVPTMLVIENGEEIGRQAGLVSREAYEDLIANRTPRRSDVEPPVDIVRRPRVNFADSPPPRLFAPFKPSPSAAAVRNPTLESRAAALARKVRELSKTHGSEHTELIAARQQLERTLTEALELKFRSEEQQVAALEQRLARLQLQLGQRKAVQSQIVERRMRELLETPATRWNTDEPSSDSSSGSSVAPRATEAASIDLQPAVQDQITVDLYASSGIYQNQKLLGSVISPLNQIPGVVANIRMVPGDGDTFVFAIVHDPSQRLQRETQQSGKESATRQAISAALNAGRINDVRWEGIDFVPSKNALPTEREAAPGAAKASAPNTPPTRKPAESLESTARLTLDLADAQAGVRATEEKLAYQTRMHAKGYLTTAELTETLQQRDRAVRRCQILLDEYEATVKDLELQLSAAGLENDLAESDHRRLIQLVEQGAVPLKEAQDAALRAVRSAHTLERLKNRLEFLKKACEGSAVNAPSPSEAPGETSDLLRGPSQPPQPAATPVP